MSNSKPLDALIVGAGFAGMYMLHRLKQLGLSALVVDKALDVGGTWYWNRYPGARCDIESMQYSYSFDKDLEQTWEWSERYATQTEILSYASAVADRYKLRGDMTFGLEVTHCQYVEAQRMWRVQAVDGDGGEQLFNARFCILATGCLSQPNLPSFDGIDQFSGEFYHTAYWPHDEVDFSGKRVGIIGTGSSGIQATSVIAGLAEHLTVFQRTPNYVVPGNNRPFGAGEQEEMKSRYGELRALAKLARNGVAQELPTQSALEVTEGERNETYGNRWDQGGLTFIGAYTDLLLDPSANRTAADFVRSRIREIVKDPDTANLLCPDSTFGCKRLCVDSDYFATFNRKNVSLVDISDTGVERITSDGVVANSVEYPLDMIVAATGFDAMTGAINRINISGKDGALLSESWKDGPVSYLGLMVAGFPNLFTITGPGSPSVLSNVLGSIEFHVEWISECIEHMEAQGLGVIEATEKAQSRWQREVDRVVDKTLYRTCNSWYLGVNIEGKPKSFMPFPGVPPYEKKCAEIASNNYPGFDFL